MAKNALYFGDNLDILRAYIPDESVDLIYLDPPFNSNRSYNVLFREMNGTAADSQIEAFDDTWHWTPKAEGTLREIETTAPPHVVDMMQAIVSFVGRNDVTAYLVMMTIRLLELHRVLQPTGSLYLHCDPTASHYLKVVLDTIFGPENFRSEITWKRYSAHNDARRSYASVTDSILFYSKTRDAVFNVQFRPYDPDYIAKYFRHTDESGRRYASNNLQSPNPRPNLTYSYKGYPPPPNGWKVDLEKMQELDRQGRLLFPKNPKGRIRLRYWLDEMPGVPVNNLWDDLPALTGSHAERLGYPTQKPLILLERIVQASSNPGDVILDPFCGCGTTVCAAQKLDRRWIGIDVTHLAIALMRSRLRDMFGDEVEYDVIGLPADLHSAGALAAEDRMKFEAWALSLIDARPAQDKRGADRGLDGVIYFRDEAEGKAKRVIVQVKSGHVQSSIIRDLAGVVRREKAEMGFLITLEPPSQPMITEALSAGFYHSPGWNRDYQRLQIRTVQELLEGRRFDLPPLRETFQRAERATERPQQEKLL